MSYFKDYHHQKEILAYRDFIQKHFDDPEKIKKHMSKLYQYMKEFAPSYADKNSKIGYDYRFFVSLLEQIEKSLPLHFILSNKPQFDFNREFAKITSDNIHDKNKKEIIEYIVHRGRCFMAAYFSSNHNEASIDIGALDLLGFCNISAGNIKFICDNLRINCGNITINPAFYPEHNLYEEGNNHSFTIVKIGEKQYIVDLTYSQFFQLRNNNYNRLGIPVLGGCGPGFYMSLTEERRAFAEKLMRDGYVEATEENIKLYFDGFAMSYRNGLYYENMDEVIYETSYTAYDYQNFIAGEDSQVKHENIAFLGRQKKILKTPIKSFAPTYYNKR